MKREIMTARQARELCEMVQRNRVIDQIQVAANNGKCRAPFDYLPAELEEELLAAGYRISREEKNAAVTVFW